jgi:dTDP-4-dehydrorhamnose 3,5-epimerase
MNFIETKIPDLLIVEPNFVHHDYRGQYFETFNKKEWFEQRGWVKEFVVDDVSISRKNTFRGLHGDSKTWKLIQCLYGEIWVVVVDLRIKGDYTFETFAINDINKRQLLIPAGCANGHLCLSDRCIFHYKQTEYYSGAGNQFTLAWDSIEELHFPIKNPIVSERDANGEDISYFLKNGVKGIHYD